MLQLRFAWERAFPAGGVAREQRTRTVEAIGRCSGFCHSDAKMVVRPGGRARAHLGRASPGWQQVLQLRSRSTVLSTAEHSTRGVDLVCLQEPTCGKVCQLHAVSIDSVTQGAK